MELQEIKKAMLAYRDYYGGDLSKTDGLELATTKKELAEMLDRHESFMEDMLSDAKSHLDTFRQKVGLLHHQIQEG